MAPPSPHQGSLFPEDHPPSLEEALARLRPLLGKDLRSFGEEFSLCPPSTTTPPLPPPNKGWAGLVVERLLGHRADNLQVADFGDWELKVIALRLNSDQTLVVKERMAITMLDPVSLSRRALFESHLWDKLRRLLIVARLYEGPEEPRSPICALAAVDLKRDFPAIVELLQTDYESFRWRYEREGAAGLAGAQGHLLEVRSKGTKRGGGLAFYGRKVLIGALLSKGVTAH